MPLGTVRAVQIDLARQIETLPTVFRYLDIAAKAGFNTIVLYLEDRIKTPSYPYAADVESYSEADIRTMVAYANERGLSLIPVVSNLGHTERFLRHAPLSHLAERRGAIAGRFAAAGNTAYNAVCPSLEETYAFFDRYIAEVAALFPSPYFHVGLDEIFDMGYCKFCRPIVEKNGLSTLFTAHILHTHALLSSLGKTMMMWDDMFEECPQSLTELPRDVVLCAWYYGYIDRRPDGHFNNRRREDAFAVYDRLGITYLASTCADVTNVESFTRYASMHNPAGMFLTTWEMAREQLLCLHPLIAEAGLLWQGVDSDDPYRRLCHAVSLVTDCDDNFAHFAAAALTLPSNAYGVQGLSHSIELPNANFQRYDAQRQMLLSALEPYTGDYAVAIRYRLLLPFLCDKLHGLAYTLWEHRSGERQCDTELLSQAFDELRDAFGRLYQEQKALWAKHRIGLPSPALDAQYESYDAECVTLASLARSASFGEIGRLDVRFFLSDQHGAPKTCISLHHIDGGTKIVAEGSYKAADLEQTYFTRAFVLPRETLPAAVTLSVSGYGGTGFAFVDAVTQEGRFIPYGIAAAAGQVDHPTNLLIDDMRPAYLGETEVQRAFLYPSLATRESRVCVQLYKTVD
ncbi:MAG: family 20 glycosylhydrolase [Clostridiaceae bacterium]|nr:family 20 glycosylhydrolase [Clostridiaceae bacterium]